MTYSIEYNVNEEGVLRAVDWNWRTPNRWARSEKEGVQWYDFPDLDNHSYQAIIGHFGLEQVQEEYPLEKIANIGWQELGSLRRELETKYGLERKEMRSDTVGDKTYVP